MLKVWFFRPLPIFCAEIHPTPVITGIYAHSPFVRIRAALIPPKPELVDRRWFPGIAATSDETLPSVRSSPRQKTDGRGGNTV